MVPDLRARCDIDCGQLLQLDSTNLQPEHWIRMARAVAERRTQYDAFVITHGTDTMAYSAAALHYMLENIDCPVVLTGSQLPAGVPGTDAEQNLLTAFHAALGGRAGVYIAFGGRVMFGNDARKLCTMQLTAFGNINRPLAGPVAGGRAVILDGYGLGGIRAQEPPMIFLPAFQYATDHGCCLVCTTQCTYDGVDMDSYEMGVRAQQLGVEPGGTLTTEALLCKLMIELAEG